MGSLLQSFGFWLSALGAAIILTNMMGMLPFQGLLSQICGAVGILCLLGGLFLVGVDSGAIAEAAVSEVKSEADSILEDDRYETAIKLVVDGHDEVQDIDESSIQKGVDFLVLNGISEDDARRKLEIVLGTYTIHNNE